MSATLDEVREALISRHYRPEQVEACLDWLRQQEASGRTFTNRLTAITAWRQAIGQQ